MNFDLVLKNLEKAIENTPEGIKALTTLDGRDPSYRKKLAEGVAHAVFDYDTRVVLLYALKAYIKLGSDYKTPLAELGSKIDYVQHTYFEMAGRCGRQISRLLEQAGQEFTPERQKFRNFAIDNVFTLAPKNRRPHFLGDKNAWDGFNWNYSDIHYWAETRFSYAYQIEKFKILLEGFGFTWTKLGDQYDWVGTVQPDLI